MKGNTMKFAARAGGAAALALGLALAVQPAAPAAENSAPSVTVTPTSGLSDGDTVTLSATGLTPGDLYHVGQCAFVEEWVYGCNAATSVDAVANAAGEVKVTLRVNKSFEAVVGAETVPWGTVDCTVTQCMAGLGNAAGEGGGVPVSFR
ncbi:enediyne antibiotic chromoprotein [Streptomyces sp. ST2-7A]|uniref:enediyne antibiotic chromoprotein n=1 Tax=Streptomyces sp. ST2-7A TaxID=2907214 RepID=UPI001EEC30E0|nr:enediyne antibiotic chromoprotein [Streptomyces sp. ST2-7A]MCE7079481.1 macromomycin [Streptomyces sp. ST2-7A]